MVAPVNMVTTKKHTKSTQKANINITISTTGETVKKKAAETGAAMVAPNINKEPEKGASARHSVGLGP